ncbi:START domain-containing protein 10-like [Pollicipes pollicipes]|uniref:START domain-containing protein 10-like n=1 Tax=Pollicipes pollicipes TaxID=41117 RepID=UPI0018852C7C|nr:START domain-containing protein 10-like [Pollicipes pollicipes]
MRLGEVRVADDHDFEELSYAVDNLDGWKLEYFHAPSKVWVKHSDNTDFHMIKVKTMFSDVDAACVYDVLHDNDYRRTWDRFMLASSSIGCLNANNELNYYAARCPAPIRNRDLVLLRSWLATERAYYVMSHSVFHAQYPPRPNLVRAFTHLTGFVVRPLSPRGCELHYITHTEPGGRLPAWLTNRVTQNLAPRLLRRLHCAALAYPAWKRKHDTVQKPWLFPEQMSSVRVDLSLCRRSPLEESEPPPDESAAKVEDRIAENYFNLVDR